MREEITHIGVIFNEQVSRSFFWLRGNAHALNILRITWYSKQKDLRRLILFKRIRIYVK